MSSFERVKAELQGSARVWLVTGGAGFIGSNLIKKLLSLDQIVLCLDNFSTGKRQNISEVLGEVSAEQRERFTLIEGDIRDLDSCIRACSGVDYVLHQAALGSVPRSIDNPIATNENNVSGFLNMLVAARDSGVSRFVYAASSSTYGDHPGLPKVESVIGKPLSPYAVTKYVNELYAEVFSKTYGLSTVGLRYFNVFGPRQDPDGAYAAVIPKWASSLMRGDDVFVNGDGETSRDFCYVENAIQANLLAATASKEAVSGDVFNVAVGQRMSLSELYREIRDNLQLYFPSLAGVEPIYREFRKGDVRHSLADISKISSALGYIPTHTVSEGLAEAMPWYVERLSR